MAKISIKSSGFKSFKPVKISKPPTTVSKPKTITPQKPTTVGKPVDTKSKTTAAPVKDKTTTTVKTEPATQVVEKQIITKEVSKPQYIYSGSSSSGFGDMLSNYIMLDWVFGNRQNTPPPPQNSIQTAPAANNNPAPVAQTTQATNNSITDSTSDNLFSALTFLSIAIIAAIIPVAVYKYYKNRQEEGRDN